LLHEWLGATSVDEFVHEHFHRAPLAVASRAEPSVPLLGWSNLRTVLEHAPDVLVVARGDLLPVPPPRSLGALRQLMRRGIGVVVRHAERQDVGLAALATSFVAELPGEIQVQLYVTPSGTHGLGWHWDREDVFIVQTAGQ
jgi:hypothetical protein